MDVLFCPIAHAPASQRSPSSHLYSTPVRTIMRPSLTIATLLASTVSARCAFLYCNNDNITQIVPQESRIAVEKALDGCSNTQAITSRKVAGVHCLAWSAAECKQCCWRYKQNGLSAWAVDDSGEEVNEDPTCAH